MKHTKPYELLVRFGHDGQVSGAHIKAQSYYMDGEQIDLGTWREEPPTVADLASPQVQALMTSCSLSLVAQLNAANAALQSAVQQLDAANEENARLRELLPSADPAAVDG